MKSCETCRYLTDENNIFNISKEEFMAFIGWAKKQEAKELAEDRKFKDEKDG